MTWQLRMRPLAVTWIHEGEGVCRCHRVGWMARMTRVSCATVTARSGGTAKGRQGERSSWLAIICSYVSTLCDCKSTFCL